MAENYNLESKERLFKEFSHFSVGERNPAKIFTNRQRGKYVGGVPLAYDDCYRLVGYAHIGVGFHRLTKDPLRD